MVKFEDEIRFIKEHEMEIRPFAEDKNALDLIAHTGISDIVAERHLDESRVEKVLEGFETKIFFMEKPNVSHDAKRVLVTMDIPGAYNAMSPLIAALLKNERCGAVEVLASGFARKEFEKRFGVSFRQVRSESNSVLKDILSSVKDRPIDVAFASVSAANGPESVALYGGKSNFGAKKLFLVSDAWGMAGSTFSGMRENMDEIDGIFCNDELARRMILHHLPDFPEEKILSLGTPVLENLELEKADEYRHEMRQRWGLDENTLAVLYLGDISEDYKNPSWMADKEINEITFAKTLDAVITAARRNPKRNFALLLRPHPRDPNKKTLYHLVESNEHPKNFLSRDASKDANTQINQAAYAADVIASIVSTENFLASRRGKKAVFLGYGEKGLGGGVLKKIYGEEILSVIASGPDSRVVTSSDELAMHIETMRPAGATGKTKASNSSYLTRNILDIALR